MLLLGFGSRAECVRPRPGMSMWMVWAAMHSALSVACMGTIAWAQEPTELTTLARRSSTHPLPVRRRIELTDIVRLRDITEQQIAHGGDAVAFVTRQALIETNDYRSTLYVVGARNGGEPRRLVDGRSISNVRWIVEDRAITYLMVAEATPRTIFRLSLHGGGPQPVLTAFRSEIESFEWSPDGHLLAMLVADPADSAEHRAVEADGLVFRETFDVRTLLEGRSSSRQTRLVVYSTDTQNFDTLWTAPAREAGALSWSPDGRRIALQYKRSERAEDANNFDIGIVNLHTQSFTPVVDWSGVEEDPVWAPDGRSLVFVSQGDLARRGGWLHINTLFVSNLDGRLPLALGPPESLSNANIIGWTGDGANVFLDRSGRSTGYIGRLSSTGGKVVAVSRTTDHLSRCASDRSGAWLSCIRQNATTPPDIALVDANSGEVRTLTHLNPEFDSIALGATTELTWKNRYGALTNGFLVYPTGYRRGQRYPFLVILYGFENRFSAQAQWITSFPVQAFAANGFAVLLMNYPAYEPFIWDRDYGRAGFSDRDNPVASVEEAVDTLIGMGMADPSRGGILGWSMGSYWTDLTLIRSRQFRAASSGETGGRSPGTYWLGNNQWRYVQRSFIGGPPFGSSYPNYLVSSPPLLAPPQDIPILREYASTRVDALEYTLWWEQDAKMELVFYPAEEHVFVQPLHRLSSMKRNLDWFTFWLCGVEDPDRRYAEQYRRWKIMRHRIAETATSNSQPRSRRREMSTAADPGEHHCDGPAKGVSSHGRGSGP